MSWYAIINPLNLDFIHRCDDEDDALKQAILLNLSDPGHPAIRLYKDGVLIARLRGGIEASGWHWELRADCLGSTDPY